MTSLRYSDSIVVARSPEALYDMISDVTRMGECGLTQAEGQPSAIIIPVYWREERR